MVRVCNETGTAAEPGRKFYRRGETEEEKAESRKGERGARD